MKSISVVLASLLLGQSAHATESYVGADLAALNLWKTRCNPFSCISSDDDGTSNGFGLRAGQWLKHTSEGKYGWEVGHAKLGTTSGSSTYLLNPGCLLLCTTAIATWRHEATTNYLNAISGFTLSPGMLTGKAGIYRTAIRSSGSSNGAAYSQRIARNGLMLGAGYKFPFSARLSASGGLDWLAYVKVTDPTNPAATTNQNLFRFSIGLDYAF